MVDQAQAIDKPMVNAMSREDRVRQVAYELYVARGGIDGDDRGDWLAAEAEIDKEDGVTVPPAGVSTSSP